MKRLSSNKAANTSSVRKSFCNDEKIKSFFTVNKILCKQLKLANFLSFIRTKFVYTNAYCIFYNVLSYFEGSGDLSFEIRRQPRGFGDASRFGLMPNPSPQLSPQPQLTGLGNNWQKTIFHPRPLRQEHARAKIEIFTIWLNKFLTALG